MEENKEIIAIILSIGAGTFSILASIFNWDFFFENKKAGLFMKVFGRKGTRIFYAALGLFLFFLGIQNDIRTKIISNAFSQLPERRFFE